MENVAIFHTTKNKNMHSSRLDFVQIILCGHKRSGAPFVCDRINGSILSARRKQGYASGYTTHNLCAEIRSFIWWNYFIKNNRHLELFGKRFTRISSDYLKNKRLIEFGYAGNTGSRNPSSLIQSHSVLSGLYSLFGISFRRSPILVRDPLLSSIASLGFLEGITGDPYGIFGGIGGGFRSCGLTVSGTGVIDSDEHQSNGTYSLGIFCPMLWLYVGFVKVVALGFIIASLAIFVYFDRWW